VGDPDVTAVDAIILGNLRHGPITIADLARNAGVSRRDVEATVEALRLEGEPIVAGNDGLRLVSAPDELAAYVEQRRHRAAAIHRGTMALRSRLRRMRESADLTLGF